MAVHPAGDGIAWAEAVDIDQPHGLDYRYINHLAKAVRKRSDKEHKNFADATVGGEHVPGGCAIMAIVDVTIDISATDGTYIGKDLIYDQASNALWCFTADGTAAALGSAYKLKFGPKSICLGADYTWTGGHEFDGSCDFTSTVVFDDSVDIKGALNCWSAAEITGNVLLDDSVTIQGTLDCWSKAEFTGGVLFDDSVGVTGALACASNVNITGDFSGTGTSHDRIASAWVLYDATKNNSIRDSYNVASVARVASGDYSIIFTTAMADANYAVLGAGRGARHDADTVLAAVGCYSAKTTGCEIRHYDSVGNLNDFSGVSIVVFGG